MSETKKVSFPCKQNGCTGIITDDPEFMAALQVGCHASAPAVFCPKCGRLYWPESGLPCRNRQHDNAFITDGHLENRPMPSAEKKVFVKEYVDSIRSESDEAEINYARDDLNYLIQKGHAPDCPAKDGRGECVCGNDDAEKWISENHNKET